MHNTAVTSEQGKKADEYFTVGTSHEFRVVSVSKQERKLALSTRLDASAPVQAAPPKQAPKATPKKQQQSSATSSSPKQTINQSSASTSTPGAKSAFQLALESALRQRDEDTDTKKGKE